MTLDVGGKFVGIAEKSVVGVELVGFATESAYALEAGNVFSFCSVQFLLSGTLFRGDV